MSAGDRIPGADRHWLDQAFALAERGRIGSSPNPMVGAVVLDAAGQLAGRGWHRRAGEPHAEVIALAEAGERSRGGTVVVTLEPCSHQGRTAPCVDAILRAEVRRVVAAATDSNPAVSGEGFRRLEAAGVEVVRNVDPERERRMNERFRCLVEKGRPFVTLKIAGSFDGRSATAGGESKWITGDGARARVQLLREEYDALAVGIGTVVSDDPRLSRRLGWRTDRPLLRVVFDRSLRTPLHARLFDEPSPVIIVTLAPADEERAEALRRKGAEILAVSGGADGLVEALAELGRREATGLLLEGGATLAASFLAAGLVDRWTAFLAPILIGGERAPGLLGGAGIESLRSAPRLRDVAVGVVGSDWMMTGLVG